MNIAKELQEFIVDCINSRPCDLPYYRAAYFTSEVKLDEIVKGLYDRKDYLSAAYLLESLSILDRNTYMLEGRDEVLDFYIILSNIFFSCLLYKKAGMEQKASILAASAYIDLFNYYKDLDNGGIPGKDMMKALFTEMTADFCLFIDKEKLEENYAKALMLYKDIDNVTQWGETCDWYWSFTEDRLCRLLSSCYDIQANFPQLGQERIPYKLSLFQNL